MKKFLSVLGLLALCVVAITSVASAGNDVTDAKNAYEKKSETTTCNGDTITITGAKKLWPPNHKYRTYTVTVNESHPGSYSWSTTTTSSQDELAKGSGHTLLDANPPMSSSTGMNNPAVAGSGTQSQDILLRAERAGGDQAGRTYTIDAKAAFDGGVNKCEATYVVTVPHDMRTSNR